MLRLISQHFRHRHRRRYLPLLHRYFTSHSPGSPQPPHSPPSLSSQSHLRHVTASSSTLSPLPPPSPSRFPYLSLLTATAAVSGSAYLFYSDENTARNVTSSVKRILNRMKQTGLASFILLDSLRSVLSSANHEVRSGFEFRVAAFLADIAAANAGRRVAIVAAGGGRVVDWLLETVSGEVGATQAEAARALAYLIADPVVRKDVFGRDHAVPYLIKFIFSSQLRKKNSSISDSLKGRSMLVAAIMDVVTSNCESKDGVLFQAWLPANAKMRDIQSAIQVIEGGLNLDDPHDEDDDGDRGLKGIGIKILGGTTVLGLSRTKGLVDSSDSDYVESNTYTSKNLMYQKRYDGSHEDANVSSAVVPGLWDDLHSQHVAVPFAAWALANWAMASEDNRYHLHELDQDGHAVMTALAAPERSVRWHGSLVARLLLEDNHIHLNDDVSEWSSSLLTTVSQACKNDDTTLALVALPALLLSLEQCPGSKNVLMKKGLGIMRDTAKQTMKHKDIQEALARALELMCTGESEVYLSLEESQKWSGVLLHWACGQSSSDKTRSSAKNILSGIFEAFGPCSVPISQAWLTILLNEVMGSSKIASGKGVSQPKSDKVKTQIDQSNIQSGIQIASQLANSVVNLAGKQLGPMYDFGNSFPLADLLSQEPFAGPYKSLNKDQIPKCEASDSAVATLKGIKALTEICADDIVNLNKITDFGVLCLLRRLLLGDDYERLAANEAYDASRVREGQDSATNVLTESTSEATDSSHIRIPHSSHIRRHAARLLTILSALPKVQKVILDDSAWCKWLEECANGKIPGCNDPKVQSYAKAALLNVFCYEGGDQDSKKSTGSGSGTAVVNESRVCPRYEDMIFLINPELPHWKCPVKPSSGTPNKSPGEDGDSVEPVEGQSKPNDPPIDVIFVHGLRGGPFKSWRISEDKSSTKSGLVEKIDQEAGKQGSFWPGEWLSADFPHARLFTLKYKTNLTQWSGASLPLQEVSSMLLEKLIAADIGSRPVVFVTHSMGGLVVKQLLHQAKTLNLNNLVNNTIGVVFYSCPHFGSRLADMPWRMGLVLRPAPSIGELRSGSPRLVELNDFIRQLQKKGSLDVLSFCETKVTPLVEGYGGWAFRMEIVPIESAYPGFGDIVVLESTDHINSCKPVNRDDPSYTEILDFLHKLKAQHT